MTLVIRTTGIEDYLDGGTGRIKALIMGAAGSGKTRSSSFWPKPLLADCEDGRMSVADRRIPYAAIKSTADMKALLKMAQEEARRPKDQQRFQTLVVDTLDAYQRIVIQEYLRENNKASMSGWQDWGHLDAEMNQLVGQLNLLPMNVIINLHVKDTKVGGDDDGVGGYLVKSPKLKGDLRDQIANEFDLVGFMDTGWEAVDGKRTLTRYIQWEPTPDKPLLKDRSGCLPAKTPVTFTEEDYQGLLRPLQAARGALSEGAEVASLETDAAPEPVLDAKGGPVGSGAKSAPAKKAAAPAAKKAAAPAARPAVPPVTTPVPAVAAPLPTPTAVPVTEAEAVAAVEDVLGGEVVADGQAAHEEPATPVATPDVVDQATQVDEPVAESAPAAGNDGDVVVACGSPRYAGGSVAQGVQGCGLALHLNLQEDRVTGCSDPEGQMPDLIQIAGLKTRAFLCNSCYAAHRNASKK
jgi:hypothetical protein